MLDLVLLAVGLAMDATAVAAGLGASERSARPVVAASFLFGAFQAGMSGLGWLGGAPLAAWASAVDHWIAFVLLAAIGAHMIKESLEPEDESSPGTGATALLGLAVATSIDALAAGVSLPVLGQPAWVALPVIGGITLAFALAGGALGRRFGDGVGRRFGVIGGLVLVGIGAKVLITHLATG